MGGTNAGPIFAPWTSVRLQNSVGTGQITLHGDGAFGVQSNGSSVIGHNFQIVEINLAVNRPPAPLNASIALNLSTLETTSAVVFDCTANRLIDTNVLINGDQLILEDLDVGTEPRVLLIVPTPQTDDIL